MATPPRCPRQRPAQVRLRAALHRPSGLLADPAVDAVFVVTRHHSHAAIVCEALRAGKAVFVEKPLALDQDELGDPGDVTESGNDRLRSASTAASRRCWSSSRPAFGARSGPVQVRYLVNAGRLEAWQLVRPARARAPASWGRAATSSTPSPGGSAPTRSRCSPPPPATRTTRQHPAVPGRVDRHDHLPTARRARRPRRRSWSPGRPGGPARQLPRTELWRGGRRQVRRSRTASTRASGSWTPSWGRRRARPMPIPLASLVATTRATFAARAAWPPALEAVADVGRPVGSGARRPSEAAGEPRVVARRLASMSPAEMAGRARDELTKRRWRGRQVPTPVPTRPVPAAARFRRPLPDGGDVVPESPVRLMQAAEGLLDGRRRIRPPARRHGSGPGLVRRSEHGPARPGPGLLLRHRPPRPAVVGNVK